MAPRTRLRTAALSIAAAAIVAAAVLQVAARRTPTQGHVRVVAAHPHDRTAFTQGLLVDGGKIYEGTGLYGRSSLRRMAIGSDRVEQQLALEPRYFGEGLAMHAGRLYQLTWREQTGFIYDPATFEEVGRFRYDGEGWGLTSDGRSLILSDGTAVLRFIDPATSAVVRRVTVSTSGKAIVRLNELEWVRGEIWANIWHEERIVRISPEDGEVLGWIDLHGLYSGASRGQEDVANGIAWDAATDRIYVTGKNWPQLFQVEIVDGPRAP